MKELIFATTNTYKVDEAQKIFSQIRPDIKIVPPRVQLNIPELQGSKSNIRELLVEIASDKAREAARQLNAPCFVEDTSLCFDALGGLPGPYIRAFVDLLGIKAAVKSARSTEADRQAARLKLFQLLAAFPDSTSAQAICVIGYCEKDGMEPQCFQGVTDGNIVAPKGDTFYWDPVFQPTEFPGETFATIGPNQKNRISHRRKAFELLGAFLP